MQPNSASAKILIVEDDFEIGNLLASTIQESGMLPTVAEDGNVMQSLLRSNSYDLIILDVMLPGEDGLSICKRIRSERTIPIILLTALGEEVDRIVGLEVGADDYITKPFSPREVVARIRSLLRRASYGLTSSSAQRKLRFDGWVIDPMRRRLHDPSNARIALTTTEFDLLLAFCRNPGRVITREELLLFTHSGLAGPIERSIDVHISRLRQKIEADPREPTLLQTVRLGGYTFTASVEEV
ncbi:MULTISPECIES: response regulator transcription factor [Neorhizobium]|uniref:Regulatory protein VirG n=1 Tax=Neorhizobium galegae bv. officinalis TaxID=323656 RepID=A0A0T7G4V4_NEOGA|nr:response regulator transcription factor [Neorhizobium galegae]CDZ56923.1 Putative two component response transcriptional regulator (OmpR family) [Neorhizobium galegae bv. orientalis]KAA9383392.1 response regulator transcription factor [Neorhizobium galegae]KAB1111556.1 response regulator transcription factor [Neorhizobium galegae]KAB1122975.1 response regulator transcription factor [Neorhizobium galegae]MCM2500261.1 response regulator transcription factor [Neorhizobium galegae]